MGKVTKIVLGEKKAKATKAKTNQQAPEPQKSEKITCTISRNTLAMAMAMFNKVPYEHAAGPINEIAEILKK